MIPHLSTSHHLANLKPEVMYTENVIAVNCQSDERRSKVSFANLLLTVKMEILCALVVELIFLGNTLCTSC